MQVLNHAYGPEIYVWKKIMHNDKITITNFFNQGRTNIGRLVRLSYGAS